MRGLLDHIELVLVSQMPEIKVQIKNLAELNQLLKAPCGYGQRT